ncbi:hypothetical protein BaRGS_00020153 [Batillaria attramentaria]|uniref:Ribosomal protein L16 n=1 Tax=Batillaria attramentaria TaxID=370345 RepID=A0ABD0KN47_9CAEN
MVMMLGPSGTEHFESKRRTRVEIGKLRYYASPGRPQLGSCPYTGISFLRGRAMRYVYGVTLRPAGREMLHLNKFFTEPSSTESTRRKTAEKAKNFAVCGIFVYVEAICFPSE